MNATGIALAGLPSGMNRVWRSAALETARIGELLRNLSPGPPVGLGGAWRRWGRQPAARSWRSLGNALRALPLPPVLRVDLGKLRPEKQNLGRIVDPDQHDGDRARGSVARRRAGLSKVQGDRKLAEAEKQRGNGGSKPDVSPLNVGAGKNLVDRREKNRHHGERHPDVDEVPNRFRSRNAPPEVAEERGGGGIDHPGDEKQESDAEDHRKGEESVLEEIDDPIGGLRLDLPDDVHRFLELGEDPRGVAA